MIACDIMMNGIDAAWINGQAPSKYDVWSVAAHEFGHCLGFAHSAAGNVMYSYGNDNDVGNRTLGLGDARGNNDLY